MDWPAWVAVYAMFVRVLGPGQDHPRKPAPVLRLPPSTSSALFALLALLSRFSIFTHFSFFKIVQPRLSNGSYLMRSDMIICPFISIVEILVICYWTHKPSAFWRSITTMSQRQVWLRILWSSSINVRLISSDYFIGINWLHGYTFV